MHPPLLVFAHRVLISDSFVLNSPRSLRACHRFGVKPVELLPRSIVEFQEVRTSIPPSPPSSRPPSP